MACAVLIQVYLLAIFGFGGIAFGLGIAMLDMYVDGLEDAFRVGSLGTRCTFKGRRSEREGRGGR